MRRAWLWRGAALAAILGLTAAAWAGFAALGADYAAFWLKQGPLIGLGTAALGWAWAGIDRHTGLVSADPLDYAGSCMQAAALPMIAFAGHLNREARGVSVPSLDLALAMPLILLMAFAAVAWLLVIAPAQYLLFLVFGAPARLALASHHRLRAGLVGPRLRTRAHSAAPGATEPKRLDGWWDASMRDRPVAMTSAFMAAGLAVLDLVRG